MVSIDIKGKYIQKVGSKSLLYILICIMKIIIFPLIIGRYRFFSLTLQHQLSRPQIRLVSKRKLRNTSYRTLFRNNIDKIIFLD